MRSGVRYTNVMCEGLKRQEARRPFLDSLVEQSRSGILKRRIVGRQQKSCWFSIWLGALRCVSTLLYMVGHSLTFCGIRNGGLGHGWERVKRDVGLKVNVNINVMCMLMFCKCCANVMLVVKMMLI